MFSTASPAQAILAEGLILLSIWKPVVLLLPFIGWCWLISTIFDKHCARFFLPRAQWNIVHMVVGLIALAGALFMPVQGIGGIFASLGLVIVLFAIHVAVFVSIVNKDERVPATHRLRINLSKLTAAREARAAAKKQGKVELVVRGPDKNVVAVPNSDTPEFQARVASESAVLTGMDNRATEITLAPTGKDPNFALSFLVDGQRIQNRAMPAAEAQAIMAFWKAAAKLDVADMRKRQTGDLTVEKGPNKTKIRVTSVGSQAGPRLSMLLDPEMQVRRKVEEIGLLENQLADLRKLTESTQGVVLIAGLADGGRTTALYTVTKLHDAYTQNVQTLEYEPQDILEGAKQNRFDPQAEGAEYSTTLRSILRRDPQVVSIAEVPDANSAKEIAKADHERVRIYAGIMANNAIDAIIKYVKLVGDQELAAKSLRGVIAFRLLRKVCINCRVPYQPPPDMLKKLGLPADKVKQLMKKGGQVLIKNKPEVCPVCQGTGYIQQDGCFEISPLDEAEREMIRTGNINGLRAEFRKRGMVTIQQAALRKAVDGFTTIEEVLRITAEPAAAPAQPAQPQAPAKA